LLQQLATPIKMKKKSQNSCQKVVKKLSKSCQKVVNKMSKSCQSCQKIVKNVVAINKSQKKVNSPDKNNNKKKKIIGIP
jgi:Mg2+ and Co2+ transporter CorA